MEFFVYSRQHIELRSADDVPHIIISVSTDDEQANFKTNELTKGVLRLRFHDKDVVGSFTSEEDLFTEVHAHMILDFVKEHKDVERIVIHCDAGHSRSPAIAAALCRVHGMDDSMWFRAKNPNKRVYRKILDAHFGTYDT